MPGERMGRMLWSVSIEKSSRKRPVSQACVSLVPAQQGPGSLCGLRPRPPPRGRWHLWGGPQTQVPTGFTPGWLSFQTPGWIQHLRNRGCSGWLCHAGGGKDRGQLSAPNGSGSHAPLQSRGRAVGSVTRPRRRCRQEFRLFVVLFTLKHSDPSPCWWQKCILVLWHCFLCGLNVFSSCCPHNDGGHQVSVCLTCETQK